MDNNKKLISHIDELSGGITAIIDKGKRDEAKLKKDISKAAADKAAAEADMNAAIKSADRDLYDNAAKRKNEAADSLLWDERRLDLIQNKPLTDPATIQAISDDIQKTVNELDADTISKVKPLLKQVFDIVDGTASALNIADQASVNLHSEVAREGNNSGLVYRHAIYDLTAVSDLRGQLSFIPEFLKEGE